MMSHSILAAIHHEKTQLLQYEGAVWNKLGQSDMLTSMDVRKSMEAIFNRLISFNTSVEELVRQYYKGGKSEQVINQKHPCFSFSKSRCHKILNSFRKANTRYLKEKFLMFCKRLVPSNIAIETVKGIVSKAFTLKNVENSLYFLDAYVNAV